jgi:uncharacterized membrane protein
MVRREAGGSGETRLETWVSYVLITGVAVSFALEVAGLILYYRTHHSFAISHGGAVFIRGRNFFSFFGRTLCEAFHGITGLHLMVLGIAALILTPYIRAITSVIYFASRRNVKYCLITLFVLAVLTMSLMMH